MHPVRELDERLVEAARGIKVLSSLGWDPKIQQGFLEGYARGNPKLPEVTYAPGPPVEQMRELEAIESGCASVEGPAAAYVQATARSYLNVARLLNALGRSEMADHSIRVYGKPGDAISGGRGTTSLDAARFFLDTSREFYASHPQAEADASIDAATVKRQIEARLAEVFGQSDIAVVVEPGLAAKAAAGASRIRLRDAACFSVYDVEQLLQHEAFVHTLTARNGREQRVLKSMSLGAPRTTATQEGLATFAELVTGSIDIARLERIALRIVAIDMALRGADFIEVFRYFLDMGEPQHESFNSTQRVFRGAPPTGGAAFTKDAVYLHGMLEVHTFFRWALTHQRLPLCRRLFAGRMTIGDTIRLAPLFDDGTVEAPRFLPPWFTRTTGLAGYLAFATFSDNILLIDVDAEHEFESMDR